MSVQNLNLDNSEQLFINAFNYTAVPTAIVAPSGQWLRVNHALCQLLGYTNTEMTQRDFQSVTHPEDLEADLAYVQRMLRNEIKTYRMEKRFIHKEGHIIWGLLSVAATRTKKGVLKYFISQVQDITELKKTQTELRQQARTDHLTGLSNRRCFHETLNQALVNAHKCSTGVGLLYIDVDNFKRINDTLGHDEGDQLLILLAQQLKLSLNNRGHLSRIGGDEFTVIVPNCESTSILSNIAKSFLSLTAHPIPLNNRRLAISFSIGITMCSDNEYIAANTLLKQADIAMYRVKESGKNDFSVYNQEMDTAIKRRYQIEEAMRYIIKNNRLSLSYQPIIDLQTGKWEAIEALLRWRDDVLGDISPEEFIPIAENAHMIHELGMWSLNRAIRDVQTLPFNEELFDQPIKISVNCSLVQLMQIDFCDHVQAILNVTQFDPKRLIIEITESRPLKDAPRVISNLQKLRKLGVGVAIDDFGTHYSSLNYIRQFPAGFLKIDRSFVADFHSKDGSEIVRLIIALGNLLNLKVIAEGAETADQVAFLIKNQCRYVQGFYFSEPMCIEALRRTLRQGTVEANSETFV